MEANKQDGSEKIRRLVVKSAVRVVEILQLQVCEDYQRGIKSKHKKIVTDFCGEAFGLPLIGERENASLWIVDGLQRITAIKKLGKTRVRAEVFASKGIEHEAEIFKLVNQGRVKLNPAEVFRALLSANDEQAHRIKSAVEGCGYNLNLFSSGNKMGSSRTLGCISTLVNVDTTYGVEALKFGLVCARECWPDDRLGIHHAIVHGMGMFYYQHDSAVDLDRFYPRLRSVTPQKILYASTQANISGSIFCAVNEQLEKVYNKRLRRS